MIQFSDRVHTRRASKCIKQSTWTRRLNFFYSSVERRDFIHRDKWIKRYIEDAPACSRPCNKRDYSAIIKSREESMWFRIPCASKPYTKNLIMFNSMMLFSVMCEEAQPLLEFFQFSHLTRETSNDVNFLHIGLLRIGENCVANSSTMTWWLPWELMLAMMTCNFRLPSSYLP